MSAPARDVEELLAAHFEGEMDESAADRLTEALATRGLSPDRLAGLLLVEGLLRTRRTPPQTAGELKRRVMRTLHGAGSRRLFVGAVMAGLPSPAPSRRAGRLRLAAATALLLAAAGVGWALLAPREAGRIAESTRSEDVGRRLSYGQPIEAGPGESSKVRLADGSVLAMQPGSRMQVPRRREAELLAGSISVKCQADRRNEFIVRASGTRARAVGTEFSVSITGEEPRGIVGPLPAAPAPGADSEGGNVKRVLVTVAVFSGVVLVSNDWGQVEAGEGRTVVSAPGAAPAVTPKPPEGGAQPVPKPPVAEGALARPATLEFVGSPLTECCKYLAGLSELKIAYDKDLAQSKITLRMTRAPMVSVIRWLARLTAAKAYELPDRSILLTKGKPDGGTELLYEADDSEEWKKEIEKVLDRKVTFEFVQAPMVEAIAFLQALSNVNFVIDPAVGMDKAVTLKGTELSLGQALEFIVRLTGAEYRLLDHAVYVTPAGKGKEQAPAGAGGGAGADPAPVQPVQPVRPDRPEVF